MSDLTPRGAPVGAGKSKIRRKELEISGIKHAIDQREVEILEKQEEIELMHDRIAKLEQELSQLIASLKEV